MVMVQNFSARNFCNDLKKVKVRCRRLFGFDFNKTMITGLVSSIVGISSMILVGKTIVANLLKMLPRLGTIA